MDIPRLIRAAMDAHGEHQLQEGSPFYPPLEQTTESHGLETQVWKIANDINELDRQSRQLVRSSLCC